ncbi:MAG: protein kinase [Ktedonobacteraceae bacterium]|nr:protein kinase [Ktedonobacteraceae bacterium]
MLHPLDTYTIDDYTDLRLDRYRIIRPLGQGGEAQVFLARDERSDRYAAIKIACPSQRQWTSNSLSVEARVLMRLHHRHIIRLYSHHLHGPVPYLALQYAPYGTLEKYAQADKLLAPHLVLTYVRQAAYALDYIHQRGLIHRDVKLGNLLLLRSRYLVLSDFGIATFYNKHSEKNITGTLRYMAPEQFRGLPCPASDQYALAIVVYELLCGRLPCSDYSSDGAKSHLYRSMPAIHTCTTRLPSAVENVLQTALAENPDDRFVNVRAFSAALEQAVTDSQTTFISYSRQPYQPYPRAVTPQPQVLQSRPARARGERSYRAFVWRRRIYLFLLTLAGTVLSFTLAVQLDGAFAIATAWIGFILLTMCLRCVAQTWVTS